MNDFYDVAFRASNESLVLALSVPVPEKEVGEPKHMRLADACSAIGAQASCRTRCAVV